MILKRFCASVQVYKKYLIAAANNAHTSYKFTTIRNYGHCSIISKHNLQTQFILPHIACRKCQVQRHYSRGLLDGDTSDLQNAIKERELKNLSAIFPNPRVTLNELAAKCPDHVFDIHYKQTSVAPKGIRKKAVQNDWTCTYSFVWPQKIKFESTAKSKRLAAEKAAFQALHWLQVNKRIDNKGQPLFDKTVLEELNNSLKEPIRASISENSMERITRIWDDYENGIKDIYTATIETASKRVIGAPAVLTKDSTIDEEDEQPGDTDLAKEPDVLSETKIPVHPVYGRHISPPTETALDRRKRQLMKSFQVYDEERTPLPIDEYSDEITSAITQSRVAVIVGAAGCGKSTRAPLAVLRSCPDATVIVSGPRRVAAVGLARRVAAELGEKVGDTVGYQVRLDSKPPRPPAGSILYCTSGVLLRRLQANPGLHGCSHVFIDEAHERDVNTDVTLLLLKRAVTLNPDLRVVVMSATLDADVFTRYFDSCPVVDVPGRTFPVETLYLEDIKKKYNLELSSTFENCKKEDGKPHVNCQEVVDVVKAVDRMEPEGAILVFLPGWAAIKQTKLMLDRCCDGSTHLVLPVHSRLSTTDQARMFSKPLPGVRKIVLATNIAETSITIPDVVYVVDSGAHKENTVKQGTGTASLDTVWVSGAGARQRAGRAGRVQAGYCFKLYTKEKENDFTPFSSPEILRVPLEQTVLDCKSYAPDDKVEDFLSQLPEPPSSKAIQFAVNDLIDLGALSKCEQLTRLGSLLSSFTVHPRLARGLLVASVLGTSAAAANVLAHCADNVEVFADAADRKEEIREIKREFSATSDHVALHWIQAEFERARARGEKAVEAWCERYGLRRDRLAYVTSITNLYLEQLLKSPVVQPLLNVEELSRFSGIDELTPAALLCGPDALLLASARLRTKGKLKPEVGLLTSKGDRAHIGSESVNHDAKRERGALIAYFGGFHSLERRALVVHKTSRVSPQAVLALCQGDVSVGVTYDDTTVLRLSRHKLDVHVPTSQVEQILKAREMLSRTIEYYIERDSNAISYEENTIVSRFKVRLVKAIGRILVEAHKQFEDGKESRKNLDK
ncbi:ATP-dependent RNA helicase DHX30-like [Cydia splendana]|uniref:ATP-dependent RNA helicase DHX30-like n=1 Tax=Cydia splendana TaxID=1100963 RepID=UPI00300CD2D5